MPYENEFFKDANILKEIEETRHTHFKNLILSIDIENLKKDSSLPNEHIKLLTEITKKTGKTFFKYLGKI
jgi:hypothetical protein